MHIVIDISKNVYEFACRYPDALLSVYAHAIKNGTPLPKGHGRIGDLDAVMSDIYTSINRRINIGMMVDSEWLWGKLNDAIYNAPTIIEADKAESDDNEDIPMEYFESGGI